MIVGCPVAAAFISNPLGSDMRGSTYAAIGVARFDITPGASHQQVWSLNVQLAL
jgi:hypothetical protein